MRRFYMVIGIKNVYNWKDVVSKTAKDVQLNKSDGYYIWVQTMLSWKTQTKKKQARGRK